VRAERLRSWCLLVIPCLLTVAWIWTGLTEPSPLIETTGTVVYVPISGGFYGILAEDGSQYLPLDLDEAWHVDGLEVTFSARPEPEAMTIYMWGTAVSVLSIARRPNDVDALIDGNTSFALSLYHAIRDRAGNLIVSPLSVSTALGMTYGAARGETARQMAEVLAFALPQGRVHAAFHALLASLDADGSSREFALANALWAQEGYGFLEEYLDLIRTQYGALLEEVDFREQAEDARHRINAWVAEKTRDRIEELLARGTVGAGTRLVLVNAIYLLAAWERPFSLDDAVDGAFHLATGETVQVSRMTQTAEFPYACVEDVQLLELPYEGGDLSMLLVLPSPETALSAVEASLTPGRLAEWVEALSPTRVTVQLPTFTLRSALSLRDVLAEMGMPLAFSDAADFSGLTGRPDLCVDDVIHEAFIEVDEQGTEAAAATAVVIRTTAMPFDPVVFLADRPFLFLLRDRNTGTILFMGRVSDPR
jgi:serpin B